MKKLIFDKQGPKISEIPLKELYNLLQIINLPIGYKKFLLIYNGGRVVKNSCPLLELPSENETLMGINNFFQCSDDYNYSLIKNIKMFNDRIPKGFIPIADASCGNLFLLGISGSNYNKVFFWDHEFEADDDEEVTYNNMYLVANTFEDFINSLYEYSLEEDSEKNDIWVSVHDKYSLPHSIKYIKHSKLVEEFFSRVSNVEDGLTIEEHTADESTILSYIENNKKYIRHVDKNGIYNDSIEVVGE